MMYDRIRVQYIITQVLLSYFQQIDSYAFHLYMVFIRLINSSNDKWEYRVSVQFDSASQMCVICQVNIFSSASLILYSAVSRSTQVSVQKRKTAQIGFMPVMSIL
jgi:hypothetical protein